VAEPASTTPDPIGGEGRQLRGHAPHRMRDHHASVCWGIGMGSKCMPTGLLSPAIPLP
jgi:hypothetical protein